MSPNYGMQERWCGSIGSVEEMQAKVLKKQEAAAMRGSDQVTSDPYNVF